MTNGAIANTDPLGPVRSMTSQPNRTAGPSAGPTARPRAARTVSTSSMRPKRSSVTRNTQWLLAGDRR